MARSRALFTNNAQSTLASSITTSSVSFNVASAAAFPTIVNAGDYFYVTLYDTVNIEVVKVTAVAGVTFTVTRAQQGTSAFAFASATTKVGNLLTANDLINFARLDDHMAASTLATLTTPSTMNGNSYVLSDAAPDGLAIIAVANTGSDIWAFNTHPASVLSTTAGASATTTVIQLANATTILPDQSALAYILQFTSGIQKGQSRFIASMTSSTITLSAAMGSAPSGSDAYVIYQHVGGNTVALAQQQSTLFDPSFVTPTTNFINGAKRITAGVVQQYTGTTWVTYGMNYVPNTTTASGTYAFTGSNGGYAGISYASAFHNQSFLVSTTAKISGVYSAADTTWDWRWDAGILAVGTVPYANVSGTPNLTVYAPIANPTFTGIPTAPTAANGTNTTQLATTAFVKNAIVFTGNATAGTKTYTASGIIEQWFESFQAAAGGGIVTITYPVAFATSSGRPRVELTDANLAGLGASNFVVAQAVTWSNTGCTVNIGQNGGGNRDVTLLIEVRGT